MKKPRSATMCRLGWPQMIVAYLQAQIQRVLYFCCTSIFPFLQTPAGIPSVAGRLACPFLAADGYSFSGGEA